MAYLKQIVQMVNDALAARAFSTVAFTGKRLYGIAATVNYQDQAGEAVREPMISDNADNLTYVGYDDSSPVTVYHKTITISRELNREASYGNPIDVLTETAQMQMIVYANRMKVKLTPEEVDALIIDSMPTHLTKAQIQPYKLRSVIITPGQSNFNSAAIYNVEYSAPSRMKPSDIFFSINYTVTTQFKQGCLELCEC